MSFLTQDLADEQSHSDTGRQRYHPKSKRKPDRVLFGWIAIILIQSSTLSYTWLESQNKHSTYTEQWIEDYSQELRIEHQ